jgi:transcriptional regulator with XRE-family HTH domain
MKGDKSQMKFCDNLKALRKAERISQERLAEKVGVSRQSVSKWETGKSLPDASVMLDLCKILEITVNDLLCGEVIVMENYKEKSEELLLEMVKEKEERDKMLLIAEVIIGIASLIPLLIATIFVAYNQSIEEWIRVVIVLTSIIPLLIALPFLIKIEQKAGYYKCSECGNCYIPTFKSVFWAMHMGRTRKMRCPKCGKKSWHKKVISKD